MWLILSDSATEIAFLQTQLCSRRSTRSRQRSSTSKTEHFVTLAPNFVSPKIPPQLCRMVCALIPTCSPHRNIASPHGWLPHSVRFQTNSFQKLHTSRTRKCNCSAGCPGSPLARRQTVPEKLRKCKFGLQTPAHISFHLKYLRIFDANTQ